MMICIRLLIILVPLKDEMLSQQQGDIFGEYFKRR